MSARNNEEKGDKKLIIFTSPGGSGGILLKVDELPGLGDEIIISEENLVKQTYFKDPSEHIHIIVVQSKGSDYPHKYEGKNVRSFDWTSRLQGKWDLK